MRRGHEAAHAQVHHHPSLHRLDHHGGEDLVRLLGAQDPLPGALARVQQALELRSEGRIFGGLGAGSAQHELPQRPHLLRRQLPLPVRLQLLGRMAPRLQRRHQVFRRALRQLRDGGFDGGRGRRLWFHDLHRASLLSDGEAVRKE